MPMALLGRIEEESEKEGIVPYSMHVSSKYLDLTKKKLELTRLPREVELGEGRRWALGTPKSVLEGVLDYWLEHYDWRSQETHLNTALPQFRTTVTLLSSSTSAPSSRPSTSTSRRLRIHFVHKRSKHANAIPLLFCHTWPSSFLEAQKIIDALTDPQEVMGYGAGAQLAFHVVVPSIPGFGFSDAAGWEEFGVEETARAFDAVMGRLGYERYVTHGSGWGFSICRALALNHPEHCVAVHTANPTFAEPTFKRSPLAFLKYRVAKLTKARFSLLSFGYVPSELEKPPGTRLENPATAYDLLFCEGRPNPELARLYSHRPQTLAFSLCDSPIGLLAGLLDAIRTRAPAQSPVTSRSRSPFLSPSELELQDAHSAPDMEMQSAVQRGEPVSPRQSEANASHYTWSATEVLNWTMLQWLPGPEAGLRWLRRAHFDSAPTSPLSTSYCSVPLGISSFRARNSHGSSTPVMWGSAWSHVGWVKRHQRPASLPAWEAPDLLVLDMRECFGTFLSHGKLPNLPTRAT
ncbi:alpha/beta-hydrolase [Lentithecium fluviatile CBS 122367]|uniref:Alpha/beta-hydrolase n=1 Tax=Lentithecium fluviatile CBS 122367 TaxID=1168545 RepID=A0A6G1J5F7_9PLEO|nr:alpha/beta-hydrolase [Lentithecium fluviatile CBS 122367]